jgi:hypothetical protein
MYEPRVDLSPDEAPEKSMSDHSMSEVDYAVEHESGSEDGGLDPNFCVFRPVIQEAFSTSLDVKKAIGIVRTEGENAGVILTGNRIKREARRRRNAISARVERDRTAEKVAAMKMSAEQDRVSAEADTCVSQFLLAASEVGAAGGRARPHEEVVKETQDAISALVGGYTTEAVFSEVGAEEDPSATLTITPVRPPCGDAKKDTTIPDYESPSSSSSSSDEEIAEVRVSVKPVAMPPPKLKGPIKKPLNLRVDELRAMMVESYQKTLENTKAEDQITKLVNRIVEEHINNEVRDLRKLKDALEVHETNESGLQDMIDDQAHNMFWLFDVIKVLLRDRDLGQDVVRQRLATIILDNVDITGMDSSDVSKFIRGLRHQMGNMVGSGAGGKAVKKSRSSRSSSTTGSDQDYRREYGSLRRSSVESQKRMGTPDESDTTSGNDSDDSEAEKVRMASSRRWSDLARYIERRRTAANKRLEKSRPDDLAEDLDMAIGNSSEDETMGGDEEEEEEEEEESKIVSTLLGPFLKNDFQFMGAAFERDPKHSLTGSGGMDGLVDSVVTLDAEPGASWLLRDGLRAVAVIVPDEMHDRRFVRKFAASTRDNKITYLKKNLLFSSEAHKPMSSLVGAKLRTWDGKYASASKNTLSVHRDSLTIRKCTKNPSTGHFVFFVDRSPR